MAGYSPASPASMRLSPRFPRRHCSTCECGLMTAALTDADRAAGLRKMKVVATGMLVVAAVVYVFARANDDGAGWIGYVRAAAEASMVGALADWFAVIAVVPAPARHPDPPHGDHPAAQGPDRPQPRRVRRGELPHPRRAQRAARRRRHRTSPRHVAGTARQRPARRRRTRRRVAGHARGARRRRGPGRARARRRVAGPGDPGGADVRAGDRSRDGGRPPPAPARRRARRARRVHRGQPHHVPPSPRDGIAVVDPRVDRQPDLREDLLGSPQLHRRRRRRPRPRGAAHDRRPVARLRHSPRARPGRCSPRARS